LGFFEDAGTGPGGFSFPVPAGTLEMFGDKYMGAFHQNLHHRKREIHEELFEFQQCVCNYVYPLVN
jgi:hypothetical protein